MIWGYILTGVISFIVGFVIAATRKDNINLNVGLFNTSTTQTYVDSELIENK